jgi:hypothetical protein
MADLLDAKIIVVVDDDQGADTGPYARELGGMAAAPCTAGGPLNSPARLLVLFGFTLA